MLKLAHRFNTVINTTVYDSEVYQLAPLNPGLPSNQSRLSYKGGTHLAPVKKAPFIAQVQELIKTQGQISNQEIETVKVDETAI